MNTVRTFKSSSIAMLVMCLVGSAHATLVDRGNGMVYDSVQNLTWLQDWNSRGTQGFSDIGRLTYVPADQWARDLVFGGFTDWRLPTAINSDDGAICLYNGCTKNEFGHLWHVELGNPRNGPLVNTGPFLNMRGPFNTGNTYFTSTLRSNPTGVVTFSTSEGRHQLDPVTSGSRLFVVAVRDGDVLSAVPEPQSWMMLLAGLAGVGAVSARRRRQR